jgi:hypothetical protein
MTRNVFIVKTFYQPLASGNRSFDVGGTFSLLSSEDVAMLAGTEHINPVQMHGGVVVALAASLTTLVAKCLEIYFARQKKRGTSGERQASKLLQDESMFRQDLQAALVEKNDEVHRQGEEIHALKEKILYLQGTIQVLKLRLRQAGVDHPEINDAD